MSTRVPSPIVLVSVWSTLTQKHPPVTTTGPITRSPTLNRIHLGPRGLWNSTPHSLNASAQSTLSLHTGRLYSSDPPRRQGPSLCSFTQTGSSSCISTQTGSIAAVPLTVSVNNKVLWSHNGVPAVSPSCCSSSLISSESRRMISWMYGSPYTIIIPDNC